MPPRTIRSMLAGLCVAAATVAAPLGVAYLAAGRDAGADPALSPKLEPAQLLRRL